MLIRSSRKKLGEILVEAGVITKDCCERILSQDKINGQKLGQILVEKKICTEQHILQALSSQLGIPLADLRTFPIEPEAVEIIPEKIAKKHCIIPMHIEDGTLQVAMCDPLSIEALDDARFASGFRIKPYLAKRSDIDWAIKKHYNLPSSLESVVKGMISEERVQVVNKLYDEEMDISDLKKQIIAAPVVQIVNLIISAAADKRASDIHIEPSKKNLIVRYRIDGLLRKGFFLPKWVQAPVVSRIKIMAGMDIAEKRLPQDGKISVMVNQRAYDLRVSTLPTKSGEKVVIRVLDTKNAVVSIKKLGLEGKDLRNFVSLIMRPQGIVLVTGPTGSGKTTTLYSALSKVRCVEKNIITIEEPIEYELEDISQVAVNEKIGLTFANTLRSVLRQDPDVIMVGEMRDQETATIAMQAALTGHLVFSTVHTNDTVSTITRLRNLGLPSYLIASTIIGIITQRLVRVLCPHCRVSVKVNRNDLEKFGLNGKKTTKVRTYEEKGCVKCDTTGFLGRTAIYEILLFNDSIRELVSNEASESLIRQAAISNGMHTLFQSGVLKALQGATTFDELYRVACLE